VLGDKLMIFGGVRDRAAERDTRISKKLFFLNVLEVKNAGDTSDFKFKLVTVGDSGVGKSCLLTRFVSDFYSDFHVSTIGVDFKTVVTMVKGKLVKLQLCDTSGQERFSGVTGNYYRNSDGFVFVFDATSRESFEHVDGWVTQVQQHHDLGPTTIKILLGNKYDLTDQVQVSEEEGQAKAKAMGALFVPTSAKTAANVDMAFLTAAQNLVEERKKKKADPRPGGGGGLQLGSGSAQPQSKSATQKCCTG
jgi:Ras-related protein Rab-1A